MGRKYYIPRTRSGSSMIASVLTQYLDNERKKRKYELQQQLAEGKITRGQFAFRSHPYIITWLVLSFLSLIYQALKQI